jgi:hypothetical protein
LVCGCRVGWNGPCAAVDQECGIVRGWGCHGAYGRAFGGTAKRLSRKWVGANSDKALKGIEKIGTRGFACN